jgi:hypothetical protein
MDNSNTMRTKNILRAKKEYIMPQVKCINIDNEISLALESTPPGAPGEVYNTAPQHFNSNPFKNQLG